MFLAFNPILSSFRDLLNEDSHCLIYIFICLRLLEPVNWLRLGFLFEFEKFYHYSGEISCLYL